MKHFLTNCMLSISMVFMMQMDGVVLPFTQAVTLAPLGPNKFHVKMSKMYVYSAYNAGTLKDARIVLKVRLDGIYNCALSIKCPSKFMHSLKSLIKF